LSVQAPKSPPNFRAIGVLRGSLFAIYDLGVRGLRAAVRRVRIATTLQRRSSSAAVLRLAVRASNGPSRI
jgi:hypothetical protein